jgi:hypothetical protein
MARLKLFESNLRSILREVRALSLSMMSDAKRIADRVLTKAESEGFDLRDGILTVAEDRDLHGEMATAAVEVLRELGMESRNGIWQLDPKAFHDIVEYDNTAWWWLDPADLRAIRADEHLLHLVASEINEVLSDWQAEAVKAVHRSARDRAWQEQGRSMGVKGRGPS